MKKTALCALAFLLFSVITNGQTKYYELESSWRITGGYNISSLACNQTGAGDKITAFRGFHAGLLCDLPLSSRLSFQGGVIYSVKGALVETGKAGQLGYCKATTSPYYLEMPLNFVGKIPLGFTRFVIGAGPYVAMGIGGQNKTQRVVFEGETRYSNRDIQFEKGMVSNTHVGGFPEMKRFDYGANALAGFEFPCFVLTANYGYGLSNIIPLTEENANQKIDHRVISFSFGFRL